MSALLQDQHDDFSQGASLSDSDDLLLQAVERFCHRGVEERLDIDRFIEAWHMLAPITSDLVKEQAARSLAFCEYAPRQIVLDLGLGPVTSAAAILMHSPKLTQLDIVRIAGTCGAGHGLYLAKRDDLGASAVAFLAGMKDSRIDEALAVNETAKASRLRSGDVIFDELLARAPEPQTASTKASDARSDAQSRLLKAAARGGRLAARGSAAAAQRPGFAAAFEKAAACKSRPAMATLLQREGSLSLETAHEVLEDDTGDTLAVFMKARDIPEETANRILILAFPAIALSVQNAMRCVRYYRELKQEECIEAVGQWPKLEERRSEEASAATAQHRPLHAEGERPLATQDRARPVEETATLRRTGLREAG